MNTRKLIMLAVTAITLAFPGVSRAGTATSSIAVSATIPSTCTISAGALGFGTYNSNSATAVTATSTLTVNCVLLAAYTVSLSKGTAATFSPRTMTFTSGGTTYNLNYNIYTDVAHTLIWGDGSASTNTVAGVGTGVNQSLTAYGQIPAAQAGAVGTFNDTVVATISF